MDEIAGKDEKQGSWPANRPADEPTLKERRAAWKERYAESDRAAGIEVGDDFKPFNQINDMFTRAMWDKSVRSPKTDGFFNSHRSSVPPRKGSGFTRQDMALRNASWAVSNFVSTRGLKEGKREGFQALIEAGGPVSKYPFEVEDVTAFTAEVKRVARLFGADLVRVTDFDERWVYAKRVDVRDFSETDHGFPEGLENVIVMGHEMEYGLVRTYPSALAGAATGMEYSHEAAITLQMVTYLRNLGFEAFASMNDTALVIPYAVKAGMGEYARNQMVITPEFGPRVRFSKIFTNAPLEHDAPRRFGVREFCDICTICADSCPPKALPYGPPGGEPVNKSSIQGVRKWTANCEKCFGYWASMGTDCAICMRVCPFNRPREGFANRLFLKLATGPLRRVALWWERKSSRGTRLKPALWWKEREES